MFRSVAFRRGFAALVAKQRQPFRTAGRVASGARTEESVELMAPVSSIRELQASLPAIKPKLRDVRIKQTALMNDTTDLKVSWYDGNVSHYPYVWMRDNCQCEHCFDQYDKKRKTTASLQVGEENQPFPERVLNLMEGTFVHITWEDGHHSHYSAKWLQEHDFERGMLPYERQNYSLEPTLWNQKLCESMQKQNIFSFDAVMEDDSKLLDLLATFQAVGFVKISDAPIGTDGEGKRALQDLISLISPTGAIKHHDRGEEGHRTVISEDAGYQTSLPYYGHVPGIQMLHCDRPAVETTPTRFIDGFAVAEQIREYYPGEGNAFDILCSYKVSFHDEASGDTEPDKKFLHRRLAPTFELKEGQVWRVNYNNACRDSAVFKTELETIKHFYSALQVLSDFTKYALDDGTGLSYHMQSGDIVLVDNWRVLVRHGNDGTYNQAFIDRDETQSKQNVLSGEHRDLRLNAE